jgi:hypothetical protein
MGFLTEPDGKLTPDAVRLIREVMALLRPVFVEFQAKGYTRDEVAQQVHQAVDFVKRS